MFCGMDQQQQLEPRKPIVLARAPTDADIRELIAQYHGVSVLIAERCAMTVEEITARIAKSTDLAYAMRMAAQRADGHATAAIREGCEQHNPVWVGYRLRERDKEAERRGGSASGGDTPIDFTREVASADECSDAELLAIILRDARPEPGVACPCCGTVRAREAQDAEIIE